MRIKPPLRPARALLALLASAALSGCPEDEPAEPQDGATSTPDDVYPDPGSTPPPAGGPDAGVGFDEEPNVFSKRPSKGSAIATDEAEELLAVAQRSTDEVVLLDRESLEERARVEVGDEPVSVTFSPDGNALYVVNRRDATVSFIASLKDAPKVVATVPVGSEPGFAALSPSGRKLYVTSLGDGTLTILDTRRHEVSSLVSLGGNPYAVCMTNDQDDDDDDETIFVTDFYSRPRGASREAADDSRQARVFRIAAKAPQSPPEITYLEPLLVKGITPEIDAAQTQAFPNQLFSCALHDSYLYVTAVGASPASFAGGTDFRQNVHGLLYAINTQYDYAVDTKRSVNLSELIAALPGQKRFAAVPNDIAFVDNAEIAYLSVQSADMVLRVDLTQQPPIAGSPSGVNFLPTDKSPAGLTIVGSTAFTYNEVGRSVSAIDLASQDTTALAVQIADLPAEGSDEAKALLGQRFFNTGLARWSTGAWVSCASCHPGGTTDNVTWSFPAGPRQTIDVSATFNQDGSVQRILNWTAIFDEIHDFELNTRGVANGVGAIVSDPALEVASRIDFVGPGGVADPENGFNVGSVKEVNDLDGVLPDWDHIELYIKTLKTPRGAKYVQGDVAAGRKLFEEARCYNCHGGPLWTLSERYYTPSLGLDLRTITFAQAGVSDIGDVRADQTVLDDLGFETAILGDDANGAPQRHFCSVRAVGTFAALGDQGRGAEELRQNGAPAQGVDGFNVPSLLGIGLGAPFLHNGAAETLEELLDPKGKFLQHLQAGNQVFFPTDQERADLVAFLKTIDDDTPTFPVPKGQNFCPLGVSEEGSY